MIRFFARSCSRTGLSNACEPSHGILKAILFSLLVCLTFSLTDAASAQGKKSKKRDPSKPYPIKDMVRMTPEMWQFKIPDGPIKMPTTVDRVATFDKNKKPCVAKVHLHVGENFLVMLPDGQIVGRKREDVSATEKPFTALTHEELAKAIIKQYGMQGGFGVEKTKNFVVIYNTSDKFAKVTGKVLQTMLEGVLKYTQEQGLDTKPPIVPLPILAFRTEAQFQSFQRMPQGVAAYYEILTNRVILKEESTFSRISEKLATEELLSTIAHEGCHQLLANIGVQKRVGRWPMWLGEGIAEYMAPTSPGKRFSWKGAGKINDLRMYELETYLQKQYINGFDGETVDETIRASQLDSTHYATAWTITYHLAKNHKAAFDRYMRYLSKMAPLHGMMPEDMKDPEATVDGNMVHFKAFFGDDIEKFENEMVTTMSKARGYNSPFELLPHFVGTAVVKGVDGDELHVGFFPMEHDMAEWQHLLRKSKGSSVRPDIKIHNGRGGANAYIKKWKRANRPKKTRGK